MKAGTRETDEGCLLAKVRDAELEWSWCSAMALGDIAQGHYVRKEKHSFFKLGTLVNENMHFLRSSSFHLSYISHQETNPTHSFYPSRPYVSVPQLPFL